MSLHTIGIAIALALGVAGLAPPVAAQGVFSRGDCDQSRLYDLTDPIVLLGFLFLGGEEPVCLDACDADDNEDLEITDAIVSLGFLFLGGPPPPPPFPREAVDPGGLDLGCLNGRLPLLELRLVPSRLTFHRLGNSAVMLLRGREESGEVVDVPLVDAEILLSADGVVEIDDGGLVVARAVGSVLVTALFQGSEAQARVEVRPGAADELVVELTSPPDGAIVSSDSVQISGRVSDPLADLTIDGPAIEPRSVAAPGGRFSVAVPLVPGKNTFQVSARRKGQEASAAIAVRRVEPGTPAAVGPDGQLFPAVPAPFTEPPDLEPPAIRIASPAAGARLESAVVDVVGTVDDPGAEVRVNAVLAVVEDGEFRVRGLRLTPGENVLVATAVDTVGNQASDEARVEVDSTRPRIFLNGPLRDGILVAGVSAVTVRGGVEPAGSSVSVAGEPAVVNGGTFSARLSLEEGLHDLVITAAAPGDGRKRSQIVRALRVDLTPPRLDILFPALESLMSSGGFSTAADSVTIAGRVFDAGTPLDRAEPVTLTVEGQPPLEAFGTFAVTVPLAAGENVLRLLTADARGNESERELRVVRETRPDARLVRLSGSDQTVEAGSAVPRPFVVRALDAFGVPAAGVPVTFRVAGGSGTFAGGVRRLDVETHGGGDASATYTAGRRAGRAAEVITVSAPGRPDPQVVFVVHTTVRSARVLVPHGPTRRLGSAGDNLSVTVRLLDDAGNPLEGEVVRFRWSEDPLPLDAGGDEALRLTDAAGRATLEFVLPPRDYSSVLEASVADGMVEAHTVRFAVRGLQAGAVLDTAIAGVLLDGRDRPLAGWIVGVVGAAGVEEWTDAAGRFSLGGVPAGEVLLEARAPDASVAGRFRVTTPVGRVRVLEDPLRLPGTEEPPPAAATLVGPERGGVLALPGLPGFRLEVPAGSVLFPDGSSSGVLRAARSNLRLAGGLLADGVLPELAVTILPEGVLFRRGVRLVLPNPGFLPGSLPHLFARSPGAGGFLETALSTVTPDGFAVSTLLPSGSRGGLYFFEIPGPAGGTTGSVDGEVRVPIPALKDVPQRQDSYVGGFNVYVHSGEFFLEETDLEIRGRGLSYRFRRRYESRHLFHGSLGWNWEHEYADRRLYPGVVPGNVIRADGSGNFDEYLMDAQTETFVSPVGRFSRLFRDAGGFLVERTPQGTRYRYFPLSRSALSGRLESIADRRGNRLRMVRGAGGRLEQVIDSLGRSIDYVHDASGRIVRVRDFAGRELTFQYDDEGNLVAATGPAITGTPNSNNFLEGRRVEYLYSAGFDDPRLRHNLLEIIDPREVSAGTRVPWLTNRYQENPALPGFDRVVAQEWGGTDATGVAAGGTLHFEYIDTPGAGDERVVAEGLAAHLLREAGTTRIRDREENVTAVRWSGAGLPLSVRLFTRAGLRPRDVTTRQPPPGTVPRFYETRYRWSVDGLLEVVEQPRGKRTEYTYDGDAPLRSSRANCVRVERHPAGEIGGVEVVERLHDPLFARVVAETAPRFALDPREAPVHRWLLDYQEAQELEALAEEAGVAPDDLADALTWAGVELGLGDLNGDGVTGQRQGNRVRQELPTATLPDGSEQTAYRLFTFNHFGQLTSRRDANGVVSRWSYYPEVDPDGDGTAQPADGLDASTGGYLEAVILDSDRVGDIAPLEVTTVYHYDVLGRVTRVVDPRRSEFEFVYNALGELVEQRMPPSLRFRRWFFYDADGHLVKTRVENFRGSDANVPLFVVGNAWIDADFSYDLLGQLVTASREV
ncbi:MAG: DUF6531 domain-containing protein, partial [Planctomycetota bacterium]|nr:DUF6531 domain-containing protein [Planctomycetota bacterium]